MTGEPSHSRFADGRLPRGRHGLPPEQVTENQRWRLLVGAGEALATSGYSGVSSRQISRHAGISSADFYKHFENADACLMAAHKVVADCVWELTSAACSGSGGWSERLQVALEAALGFLGEEPPLARLLCADLAVGVPAVAAERELLLARLADLLRFGRSLCSGASNRLPPEAEVHLAGATIALLGERIIAGELRGLSALIPELTAVLAAPYRG